MQNPHHHKTIYARLVISLTQLHFIRQWISTIKRITKITCLEFVPVISYWNLTVIMGLSSSIYFSIQLMVLRCWPPVYLPRYLLRHYTCSLQQVCTVVTHTFQRKIISNRSQSSCLPTWSVKKKIHIFIFTLPRSRAKIQEPSLKCFETSKERRYLKEWRALH